MREGRERACVRRVPPAACPQCLSVLVLTSAACPGREGLVIFSLVTVATSAITGTASRRRGAVAGCRSLRPPGVGSGPVVVVTGLRGGERVGMEVRVPLHPDQGAITASQPGGERGAEGVDGLLELGVSAAPAGKGSASLLLWFPA